MDLLKELREPKEGWSGDAACVSAEVAAVAADEIERLRSLPNWDDIPAEVRTEILTVAYRDLGRNQRPDVKASYDAIRTVMTDYLRTAETV